jgi:hypothetical protein
VLIEPIANDGFKARAGEPFGLTAEGATVDEALKQLRTLIEGRLAAGARVMQLQLPLARWAGTWKPGDPLIAKWKQAVEDYRQEIEEDPRR